MTAVLADPAAPHPAGFVFDPALPLREQAMSLAAELEALKVFLTAAHKDLEAGEGIQAEKRLKALTNHQHKLREALARATS